MIIEIDFNSVEALYLQLRNQIILGIALDEYHEGDPLPSVRQLADDIGINMHTVNKAYSVLRQDGYVKVDRRRGERRKKKQNGADMPDMDWDIRESAEGDSWLSD